MKQIILIFIFLAGCVSVFSQESVTENTTESKNALQFTITTDKTRYALGETVGFVMTWKNTSKKNYEMPMSPSMGIVSVFNAETNYAVPYRGAIACGEISYKTLAVGEKFEIRSELNNFIYPNFELTSPGRYTIKLGSSDSNSERDASFEIFRLDETGLEAEREKATAGDKKALQILAAHGDDKVVNSLAEIIKNGNEEMRRTVYQALVMLNTENSMRILAETATTNLPPLEKTAILRSILEMKAEPNPSVIFYMRKLLDDNWVNGTMTSQAPNEPPKTYKQYTIRKYAYFILKRFNIEAPTVYEEEVTK